jgi:hypothetical protein
MQKRIDLSDLKLHELVGLYKAIIGAPGDYARRGKDFYRSALAARGDTELRVAYDALTRERKPRKVRSDVLEKRTALANAKEFHALVRAFHSWGADLVHNPEAHGKLLDRATKALSAAAR